MQFSKLFILSFMRPFQGWDIFELFSRTRFSEEVKGTILFNACL